MKDIQQQAFRLAFGKQGNKRYLRTCYYMQARNSSWSMGYCVDNPAKINDVLG